MSDEHFKNEKWDITVHARGGGYPGYDYPYTGPEPPAAHKRDSEVYLTYYWTDWTVNGVREKTDWPKDVLTIAGFVPSPFWTPKEQDSKWNVEGEFAMQEFNGRLTFGGIPGGCSNDEILQEAFFGEMLGYLKEHRPPQPQRRAQ